MHAGGLLFVVMLVHVLLRCCRRTWGFTRGELITAMVMMVATAIPRRCGGLYEGGMPVPWMPVLLRWLAFYGAFYLALVCVMAILRRQWVEHERLPLPMAQVPLDMFRFAAGVAGMTVWLWQAGMPGWVAPIFVLAALVIFTGSPGARPRATSRRSRQPWCRAYVRSTSKATMFLLSRLNSTATR